MAAAPKQPGARLKRTTVAVPTAAVAPLTSSAPVAVSLPGPTEADRRASLRTIAAGAHRLGLLPAPMAGALGLGPIDASVKAIATQAAALLAGPFGSAALSLIRAKAKERQLDEYLEATLGILVESWAPGQHADPAGLAAAAAALASQPLDDPGVYVVCPKAGCGHVFTIPSDPR